MQFSKPLRVKVVHGITDWWPLCISIPGRIIVERFFTLIALPIKPLLMMQGIPKSAAGYTKVTRPDSSGKPHQRFSPRAQMVGMVCRLYFFSSFFFNHRLTPVCAGGGGGGGRRPGAAGPPAPPRDRGQGGERGRRDGGGGGGVGRF